MKQRAKELLESGRVVRVLGWQRGDFPNLREPVFFTTAKQLDNLEYDRFCAANLSKYLIGTDVPTLAFLKPCDTYSLNQLVKERQINRQMTYIIGIGCEGSAKLTDMEENGTLERCLVCTKTVHAAFDELIGEDAAPREKNDRFAGVGEIEAMEIAARYTFWQDHLARCIRCNACRNICPVCHCKKCVFDNTKYDTAQRANASAFEEQMFHIIRAYHVAGRCTDCGECNRACPQAIPLHLLNRKLISDINHMFGEYQAGTDTETPGPLTNFDIEMDKEVGL